jgi:deoxyhypusine synthase
MNVLIFTQEEYDKVIVIQEGQHRIGPVALTNGTYFVMEDVLTEMTDGIYKDKLKDVNYTIQSFDSIQDLLPLSEENDII